MFSLKSDLRFYQFEVEWSNKLWFAGGERCEIPICIAPNPVVFGVPRALYSNADILLTSFSLVSEFSDT